MARRFTAHIGESGSSNIAPPLVSGYVNGELKQLTILVVGGHPLVAEGIRSLVEQMDICGEARYAANAVAAVKILRENHVDLVILDLADDSKMEALTAIREYDKAIPAIVLSVAESARAVRRAVNAGASGFVAESAPLDFLMQAISIAVSGRRLALLPLDSITDFDIDDEEGEEADTSSDLLKNLRERYGKLTEQEAKVLGHIKEGLSNKEIARELGIFEGTVKVHVKSILRKLNAKNRTVAALMAAKVARAQ